MNVRASAIKLVAFFAVCGLITTYLAIVIGDLSLTPRHRYGAVFDDVSGLKPGSPVRIAGVKVGSVSDVRIHGGTRARVDFEVDESVTLSSRTELAVRYKNLIGDRYLELTGGQSGADVLEPGTVIPATRTAAALDLDTLLDGFQPLFQGLDSAEINALSTDIVRTLQGEGGTVRAILSHVGSLTGTLADRDEVVGEVIDNLRAFLDVVASRESNLDALVTNVQSLVTGLDRERRLIGTALTDVGDLGRTTADLLAEVRPDLRANIESLDAVAGTLASRQDTLRLVLDKLPDTYARLARYGSYGNFFNFYVCALRFKVDGPDGPMYTPYQRSGAARCED
ncbi:MlaD family protein [Aeromicrobium sp. NPDC092404]|uniref:MlaD family protein n=1 Tax=Aeromicrobium sp. NPDC092404 TaxID=3154976 RepID=UPI003438BB85